MESVLAHDAPYDSETGRVRVAFVTVTIAIACVSAAVATQFVAWTFGWQPALGTPVLRVGEAALYAPWSVFTWSAHWGDAYPRIFTVAWVIMAFGTTAGWLLQVAIANPRPRVGVTGREGWGSFEDAEAAGLFSQTGLVLGKLDGEVLCHDGPGHQLLVGASRSGKGRGHIVPTLLAWPDSALVLDVKGELAFGDPRHGFPGTAGFRRTLGPTLFFAPTEAHSCCINPMLSVHRGATEVRDAQNLVEALVNPHGESSGSEAFWNNSGKNLLVGVVLHVLYAEPLARKTLAVVREKLRDLDRIADEMRVTLHRPNPVTGQPEVHPEVLHAAESYLAGEERLRSGIKATAESFFGIFADPMVAAKTATSDFTPSDLMCHERPVTLYLQPPPSDAQRLMPLMRLVLNQIARTLMEDQTSADGRPKRRQLLLLLDEFAQLGRMKTFEAQLSAMAGYGLKGYLVCQSFNQITGAYGRDNTILDNCHVVTAFAAADMETAKRIAEMAGEVWEMRPQESDQRPRALLGPRKGSVTWREERRPLLLPGDVRRLPRDEQLIFVSGAKPLRTKKLAFDREPIFARRLLPASKERVRITTAHDWIDVAALGRDAPDRKTAKRAGPQPAPARNGGQGDLFAGGPPISERALAGLRPPARTEAAPPRAPRQTGV